MILPVVLVHLRSSRSERRSSTVINVDLIDATRGDVEPITQNTLKAEEQAQQRKREFFHERIHLIIRTRKTSSDESTGAPTLHAPHSWKIQRFRLTPDFVQQLVDRTVKERGVTVAYLKDVEGGEIIIPGEIQRLCEPVTAATYNIVLSYPNQTKDIGGKHSYHGQLKFVIRNIPSHSQNHLHVVEEEHVSLWVKDGIVKEDPEMLRMEKKLESLGKLLEIVNNKMVQVSEEPMTNDKGIYIYGKKADDKRERMYTKLQQDKNQIRLDHDNTNEGLQTMRKEKFARIDIVLEKSDENVMSVEFRGKEKKYFEDILLHKTNWKTSFMYAAPKSNGVGTSTNVESDPDSDYLVDTGSISVERLESGFGCFHRSYHEYREGREKLKGDTFDQSIVCYHGSYADGKRQGFGVLYTTTGLYSGGFHNDLKCGSGIEVHKDGDVVRCQYGKVSGDKSPRRYHRGLPNGRGKITFSDGAFYEGDLFNGTINGYGIYFSARG